MTVDTELEQRLRSALHEHAELEALPDRVLLAGLAGGRSSLRRRRRRGLAGVAASLLVVSGLALVAAQREDGAPQPTVPSPSPTPSPTPAPETVAPVAWAAGLPFGAPPDVPYLAGTTVVLPNGRRVALGAEPPAQVTGAGIIGLSVAGLVLLVEHEVAQPYSFSSRYVLVGDDGEQRDLPVSTLGAQEAVVSPDGGYFTGGGDIIDLANLSVAGHVPERATILFSWTTHGILYSAGDYGASGTRYHLLPDGDEPRELADDPGLYVNGTDVGIQRCRVVRLLADGTTTPLSGCIDGLRSVSPSGQWALTDDLRLVDVATGEQSYLAGTPVSPTPYGFDKVHWDGEDSLLFPVGSLLVRCTTSTATCERATRSEQLPQGSVSLP
jgi:hypothetical protein